MGHSGQSGPRRPGDSQERAGFVSFGIQSPQFDYRLIIATTDDIGRNALETLAGQEKPVGLVLRGELLNAQVEWPTGIVVKKVDLNWP